jgi:hypothetical protein
MFIFWPVFAWTMLIVGFLLGEPGAPWHVSASLWLVGAVVFGLIGWIAQGLTGLWVHRHG